MRPASSLIRLVIAAGALLPSLALAHPQGHAGHDFMTGIAHPFTGIDHLLAMIAVGLWAARLGKVAIWTLPIVFPAMMVGGALLALGGVALPAIEAIIAASVIVLGLLVAAGLRMPIVASAALVACFAAFHGFAHATEAPSPQFAAYATGFVIATVVLHAIGIATGLAARHSTLVPRIGGSMIALTGAGLLLTS
jgi:urease accessory protein